MKTKGPTQYFISHWMGLQSLGWSFWVNLVAVRVGVTLAQSAAMPYLPADLSQYWIAVPLVGLLIHGVLFAWQVIGVLRAGERYIAGLGSVANTWGAQFGILVAFWITLGDLWGLWLLNKPILIEESFTEKMAREHASQYDLAVDEDGLTARFSGTIDLGATKAFAKLLGQNKGITTLVLTSDGGNIYEARGLAKLARDFGLDTRASGTCTSACTTTFSGGKTRVIEPDTRIGFHRYRVLAAYDVPLADPRAEEARDLALFRQAGFTEWFLTRVFKEGPGTMWFPTPDELLRGGVVTSIIE